MSLIFSSEGYKRSVVFTVTSGVSRLLQNIGDMTGIPHWMDRVAMTWVDHNFSAQNVGVREWKPLERLEHAYPRTKMAGTWVLVIMWMTFDVDDTDIATENVTDSKEYLVPRIRSIYENGLAMV